MTNHPAKLVFDLGYMVHPSELLCASPFHVFVGRELVVVAAHWDYRQGEPPPTWALWDATNKRRLGRVRREKSGRWTAEVLNENGFRPWYITDLPDEPSAKRALMDQVSKV